MSFDVRSTERPNVRRLVANDERSASGLLVLIAALSRPLSAQSGARNGEWRSWAGDLGATRYAPLDQINAANFNKLEVAWRFKTDNLGPRPDFNLQASPLMVNGRLYFTAGSRRARRGRRCRNGRAAVDPSPRGRRARRQLVAPAVGPRRRLLDRRQGRRADLLRLDRLSARRPRREDRAAAEGLRRQRGGRSEEGQRPAARPRRKRRRLERRASRRAQRRHRRRGAPRRHRAAQQGEREGLHPRLRRTHRQAPVDLPHDPGSWRVRQRHLAERLVVVHRAHRRLDAADGRRGTGDRLPAGGNSDGRLFRRAPARQQSVRRKPGRAESRNGQAALALPVRAPPDLGLRRALRADPRQHHRQRQGHQGDRTADQTGFRLRVRQSDRSARVADRRAACRTGQGADGVVFADAALPHQASAIRAAGLPGERRHRFHAGAQGRGDEDRVAVQDRSAVHAADRSRRGREDRHALRAERRQLAGRLARSRHQHPLPVFALADARACRW